MNVLHELAIVAVFRQLGIFLTLSLTTKEAATLSVDDVAALRELGATDALLDQVRALGDDPSDRVLEIDFETMTVRVVGDERGGMALDDAQGGALGVGSVLK